MTFVAEPGLRERKRVATKRAIELAAIKLVALNGLEHLTVDEIVHSADVSPRTFFNYFPSKEAALIGDTPTLANSDRVDVFVTAGRNGSVFTGLRDLLTEAAEFTALDHEITQLRRSVLKKYPELFAMRMATMRQFEEELGAIIARRLAADDPALAVDQPALVEKARLVAFVAFAAIKHAWACWSDAGAGTDLTDRIERSFAELESLFSSSEIH
jgi:AcrR family transcriptional regulator